MNGRNKREKTKLFYLTVISILIVLNSILVILFQSRAAAQDKNVLWIGIIHDNPTQTEASKRAENYMKEYLDMISTYTNWKYEYRYGSTKECLQWLEEGKIEILSGLSYTPERAEKVNFSVIPMTMGFLSICVKEENQALRYEDYQAWNQLRLGLLENKEQEEALEFYIEEKGLQLRKQYYHSEEELYQALEREEVDMILIDTLSQRRQVKSVAKFAPFSYYCAFSKKEKKLYYQFNEAQGHLKLERSSFEQELYQKYYTPPEQEINLTTEQQEYIRQKKIRTAIFTDWKPLQYQEKETGKAAGISVDFIELISQKTGLIFEYVLVENNQECMQLVEEGQIDIICGIDKNFIFSDNSDIVLSDSYLESRYVLVTSKEIKDITNTRVALPSERKKVEQIERNSSVFYYDNLEECIKAVNRGEVEWTYGNAYQIEQIVQNPLYNRLLLSSLEGQTANISIGFFKKEDTLLRQIIDKAIHSISEKERQDIIYKHTLGLGYQLTVETFIYMQPIIFILIVCTIASAIIFLIFYISRSQVKVQKQAAQKALLEEERYRVATEIANDILFEYTITTDTMKNAEKYKEIFGREPVIERFTEQKKDLQYIHIEDISVFEEYCRKLRSGIDKIEVEYRMADSSGEYVWCHLRGKTILSKEGRPLQVIGKIVNIDIQKRELEKLQYKAQRDPFTNVYNKSSTEEMINAIINQESTGSYAFFILDIDYFKQINDRYGHLMGDRVIKEMVEKIRSVFKEQDIIGRIGGDEFVIFIKAKKKEQVIEQVELLEEEIRKPIILEGVTLHISTSIGISLYPLHGCNYMELCKNADAALYQVKENGRDNYAFAGET